MPNAYPCAGRTCANCVRYTPLDQWHGHCEEHDQGTEPDDICERWDGDE